MPAFLLCPFRGRRCCLFCLVGPMLVCHDKYHWWVLFHEVTVSKWLKPDTCFPRCFVNLNAIRWGHSVTKLKLTESLLFIKANKEWVDKIFHTFLKREVTWDERKKVWGEKKSISFSPIFYPSSPHLPVS